MSATADRPPGTAVSHQSPERAGARGKAARAEVPRRSHAEFGTPAPSIATPSRCSRSRPTERVPELVPVRYGRMLASPFAFFRGAAAIMAADLAATPRSGLQVQLCGDAHLSNFGGFASPERELVFDINDFDETLPGPWEWDVKRLAASVRDRRAGERVQAGPAPARRARRPCAAYREAMRDVRRHAQPRACGTRGSTRRAPRRGRRSRSTRRRASALERLGAKAQDEGQPEGALASSPT